MGVTEVKTAASGVRSDHRPPSFNDSYDTCYSGGAPRSFYCDMLTLTRETYALQESVCIEPERSKVVGKCK